MTHRRFFLLLLIALVGSSWIVPATTAQEFSIHSISSRLGGTTLYGDATSESLTRVQIQSQLDALESQLELPDDERADIESRLNRALVWLKNAKDAEKLSAEYRQQIQSAPNTIARLRAELDKLPPAAEATIPNGWGFEQLTAKMTDIEHTVQALADQLAEMDRQIDSRPSRIAAIAKEIPETKKRITEVETVDAEEQEDGFREQVLSLARQARLQGLRAQLDRLKAEKTRFEALAPQWPLERDLSARRLANRKSELTQYKKIVKAWRRNESKRYATATRELAEKSHPVVRDVAMRNAEIAEFRVMAAKSIESASAEIIQLTKTASELAENFESLQSKVLHAAEATSTGILLRKQRDELPDWKESRRRHKRLQVETPKAHLLLMELKDERREVADPDRYSDELVSNLDEQWQRYDKTEIKNAFVALLQTRRDLLDKLIADQDLLLRHLSELEVANQDLDHQLVEFRTYLDEHVLWVRSNNVLSASDFAASARAIVSILQPNQWAQASKAVVGETMRRPTGLAAAIALLILAFAFRKRLVRRLEKLCEPPKPGETIRFGKSLPALAISVLLSAGWPTVLLAIGYKLSTASAETEFTQGLGTSCLAVACLVWGCQLFREICLDGRLGHRMFGWPPKVLSVVRRTLELAVLFGGPLIAILFLTDSVVIPGGQSLHRLVLVLTLTLVAVQGYALLRPRSLVMRAVSMMNSNSLVARFRQPICVIAVAVPTALAAISIYGYHYSATQLSGRFAESLVAILAIIILHALALRWLRLNGYNSTLREQQEQPVSPDQPASQVRLASTVIDANNDGVITTADDLAAKDEIDWQLTADIHIRELLRYTVVITLLVGGWFIWAEVLPALGVLDRVELWDNTVRVSEMVTDASGQTSLQNFETNAPTTLKDLLTAMIIIVATLQIGNRLTSLLEVTLSDRLPIDRGARYAIAILIRYAATIAGIVTACYVIRLSWGSVQWLAAAMTVGLGFGLQEIFANLVSGLIILFERPIRAGDVVTVGDVTGTVSRMQMRATTITDFDRRELIVPNRKFITDNVINWTLTDPICRTIVSVGVAYGTDTDMVKRVLMTVAQRSPLVLDSPQSCVVFGGFGDSTLDFELRVFIAHREKMPEVVSELNLAINREFDKSGIEIAFPAAGPAHSIDHVAARC